MTELLMKTLKKNYQLAKESGDPKRIEDAREAIDDAQMECQAHTAERVKGLVNDVGEIKSDVKAIQQSVTKCVAAQTTLTEQYGLANLAISKLDKEFTAWKERAKGAKMLYDLGKVLVGAGLGGALLKLLGS